MQEVQLWGEDRYIMIDIIECQLSKGNVNTYVTQHQLGSAWLAYITQIIREITTC